MRISDWSSDVCSSDLHLRDAQIIERNVLAEQRFAGHRRAGRRAAGDRAILARAGRAEEIGGVGAGLLAPAEIGADFPAANHAVRELAVEARAQRLQAVLEAQSVGDTRLAHLPRADSAP